MKALINDGGQAFPRTGFVSEIEANEQFIAQYENKPQEGMTLRDYFAGQVLAEAYREAVCFNGEHEQDTIIPREVNAARTAYCLADSMLAERERKDGDK